MTLSVIGAGLGRTGTHSLKLALEQLGFGPCYHMVEVFALPERKQHWARAAAGHPMDWDKVFAGYASTTDWPACDYWRELADAYPEAKIILTIRDPEGWFRSTQDTIFSPETSDVLLSDPAMVPIIKAISDHHFGGGPLNDRDRLIDAFNRHNQHVERAAPPGRLLVYQASQGWDPLCRFLGVDVPATPFPAVNSTQEFQARLAASH